MMVLAFSILATPVFALDTYNEIDVDDFNGDIVNPSTLIDTDKYIQELRIGEYVELNVPLKKQMNEYYCGPASARMSLLKFGINVKQSTIGRHAETNYYQGTIVQKLTISLNHFLEENGKTPCYYFYNAYDSNFTVKVLENLRNGVPVICHVMTGGLPNYQNNPSNTGHYIVIKGFSIQADQNQTRIYVRYNDPHYKNAHYGTYSVDINIMENAVKQNAGYFICG